MKEQEKQLIHRVLKGDISSFSYFVTTYQNMALTVAYRICKNKQDAEDIVQEAFIRAFHNLHTFRFTSKFSTWFYRIVYNTAISEQQTTFFNTEFEEYEASNTSNVFSDWNIISAIETEERKLLVNSILDSMPNDEALILTLFYLEENSVKDVSLMVGISEANVKVRLHRARKSFGTLMEKMNLKTYFKETER